MRLVPPVLAALLVGALLAATGPAEAHDRSWRTATSFGMGVYPVEAALGTISSPNAGCVNNRKVKLFQVRPGRDRLLGVDRRSGSATNGDGYWTVRATLSPARRYYAVVLRKNVGSGAHDHLCKPYRTSRLPGV